MKVDVSNHIFEAATLLRFIGGKMVHLALAVCLQFDGRVSSCMNRALLE